MSIEVRKKVTPPFAQGLQGETLSHSAHLHAEGRSTMPSASGQMIIPAPPARGVLNSRLWVKHVRQSFHNSEASA